MDGFQNYLGPFRTSSLLFNSTSGQFNGTRDQLNGSYLNKLVYPEGEVPLVTIRVQGKQFPAIAVKPVCFCLPSPQRNYIGTWLVLGPIFNPAQQIGDHSPKREKDFGHPWADEIITDIDNRHDQLNPFVITASPDKAPVHGDTLAYGNKEGKIFKERK